MVFRRQEKCAMELDKCINGSSSCPEKMKCFWKIKKCMMPHGGRYHKVSNEPIKKSIIDAIIKEQETGNERLLKFNVW